MQSICCFCQILMKLEYFRQNFEKYSNIKFSEYPLSGTELFHADERTDGQTFCPQSAFTS
jgi:hypothetical protein